MKNEHFFLKKETIKAYIKENKKNSGVTLISLIVMIIVLFILASITVALVTGQNGLINQAEEAKRESEYVTAKEKVEAEVLASHDKRGRLILSKLVENLNKIGNVTKATFPVEVIVDGRSFTINSEEDVERTIPQVKLSNLKITTVADKETEITTLSTNKPEEGTPLEISFDVSISEGAITAVDKGTLTNGKVTYDTDGTETEVTFTFILSGVDSDTPNTETIDVSNYYKISEFPIDESGVGYYIKKGNEYAIVFADRVAQAGTSVACGESSSEYVNEGCSCVFPKLTQNQKKTQFKTYRIKGTYTDRNFGEKSVLEVVNSTGEDRFMALALSDFGTNNTTYTWYKSAWDEPGMKDFNIYGDGGKGYPTSRGFLKGKTNTETMITKWNAGGYGEQDDNDIWGQVQTKATEGWFIPSFEEWSAFTYAMSEGNVKSGVTRYGRLGLKQLYWSSSQQERYDVCNVDLSEYQIWFSYPKNSYSVRLTTTY